MPWFCGNSRNTRVIRMPRPRKSIPTPRCHKGAAVIDVYRDGARRTLTLGPWGSEAANQEYARVLAELNCQPSRPAAGPDVTVNEILLVFLDHAERHYRRADGSPTDEVKQYKQTFRLLRELYGHTPAKEFGPLGLKALRQRMIEVGWSRKLVNQRVGRVKRVFKWAASEERVSVA